MRARCTSFTQERRASRAGETRQRRSLTEGPPPTKGHGDRIGSSVVLVGALSTAVHTHTHIRVASGTTLGRAEGENRRRHTAVNERARSLWRDADNMRVSVFVSVALVAVLLAEGTSSGSCVHFVKPRTKPREIRGFQPEYISTAYGFGKREIAKQDKYEKIMLLLLQNSPQSIPASWFLHEMRQNPELAKRIVRKIVDGAEEDNPGKLSTAELFKSERKISFF